MPRAEAAPTKSFFPSWKHPLSPLADILYGTLPTPTFELPDGRLQPDFLMDTFPDWVLFVISFGIVGGIAYLCQENTAMITAMIVPVLVHWTLFFGHGLPARSEKFFDLAGQIGFSAMLLVSMVTRDTSTARSNFVAILALIWSVRLGYFLFTRFLERGEDWRFVRARHYPGFHFFTWTSQGLWCFFQGQAIIALNHESSTKANAPKLGTALDYLGLAVWSCGLLIEAMADLQKLDFVRRHPVRETRKWIDEGLWAYSKHANFFGETMVWVGISILCMSGVGSTNEELGRIWFAPIFSGIFLMQTTVPWLDILARKKYGAVKGYDEYCRAVSNYILLPRRPTWI